MTELSNISEATTDEEPTMLQAWTNPLSAELERRKEELLAMPGYELKVDLEALGRAGRVIYNNSEELRRHAGLFLGGGRHVNEMTDEYEDELVRFLHNYLTSVTSLIDSQRVVMRHRWGSRSEFETVTYSQKLADTFDTGEADFMTKLRNYCTHRSIPVPGMVTTLLGERGRPPRFVNELKLDRDELLKWDSWTAPSKAYLQAREPQFDLLPVIESYMTAASRFFNWFTSEINEQCADLRAEYLSAAVALRAWYQDETGLTDEFVDGPTPPSSSPGARVKRRQAEKERRKARRRNR